MLSDSSLTNAISSESKFEAQAGTGKLPGNDPRFRFGNPDLEQVPEMTEIPSFLGTEYQARQCGRVLRSGNVRYHPFI